MRSFRASLAFLSALAALAQTLTAADPPTEPVFKLVSKEIILPRQGTRPPLNGFYSYVGPATLIRCIGWIDDSDTYDDYAVSFSRDGGKTWGPEEIRWKSVAVPGGKMRFHEPAAFFDPAAEKLFVLTDKHFYPNDKDNDGIDWELVLDTYDARTGTWSERRDLALDGQHAGVSFSFPIKTKRGRILFPGQRNAKGPDGKVLHAPKSRQPVQEAVFVIGESPAAGGEVKWHLSQPISLSPEISSRGICEPTLAELPDGRIAAVCRGSNHVLPGKPGYKWLSFSRDDGETWSAPVPLPATGGDPIESGANGSALIRSVKNGKLYWLGNLALNGEHASANWPRSPLVIAEVQEDPFALKRDTLFIIDQRADRDSPKVQLSNFRYYQERDTGDLLIFLTRLGAESEKQWRLADGYRYRVRMP
jgi:hypothetical protein